jgi:hypothetical protein
MQVADEIAQGHGEYLRDLAKRVPPARKGRPVTTSCLSRWINDGVRTADGRRVRLEAATLAGRWLSTPAAFSRFLAAQTPAALQQETALRPPTRRNRAAEQADKALEALGI